MRLKTRPPGNVEVEVYDPNDKSHWRNYSATLNRVFVDNSGIWNLGWKPNGYHATKLTFTPSNWNQWQTVRVKVACTSHYRNAVPLEHSARKDYGDYRSYGRGGTVWVHVKDAKGNSGDYETPIEVKDLAEDPGQEIVVIEGQHKDFRIKISDELLPDGGNERINVGIAAWNRDVATVGRRDGTARRSGTFSDLITFTKDTREQTVRLRGVSASDYVSCGDKDTPRPCDEPGTTSLYIAITNLVWGDLDAARTWTMTWPVRVTTPGGQTSRAPARAEAVQVPTAPVANVQLSATDAATASVTWDAVQHATSYHVSWEAAGSDPNASVAGVMSGVTGTSTTIQHGATEPMTLTVTVTPEYVDGNGDTVQLDDLAGTATLAVGPGGTQQGADAQATQAASCVSDELMATAESYYAMNETHAVRGPRWFRVLMAFGARQASDWTADGRTMTPFTAAEAREREKSWHGWGPFVTALECLETAAVQPAQAEAEQPEQASVPVVSVVSGTLGGAVTEGAAAGFLLKAAPAPQSDLTVGYTVGESGAVLAAPGAGSRTVTIPAGQAETSLTVATDDDAVDEADGSVSVTLDAAAGYTVAAGQGSATVTVRDNDEPVVSIAAGARVTEGASASFTVTASPAPHAPLDVTVTVTQSGDFAAPGATGEKTVTVPTGGSVAFEVATEDDSVDEADGSIAATLDAGAGYTVAPAPGNAASVEVADNDAAAAGTPTLSIGDETVNESDGLMWFTVQLSPASDRAVSVRWRTRDSTPVSAEKRQDYLPMDQTLYLWPGQTEKRFWVYAYNDSHDEGNETFEVVLSEPTGGAAIGDGVAVGTIVNSDPMPAAWLARFGRTAAEQALDGIAGRMAAPRAAGVEGSIAGQALNFVPGSGSDGPDGSGGAANDNVPGSFTGGLSLAQSDVARAFGASAGGLGHGGFGTGGFGHDAHGFGFGNSGARSHTMTAREALLGSSFTATGEKDGTGGSLALWGRAAQSRFDGREGSFSLDGEATTAMLGADYARDRWLVGMALMQTSGKGGYRDTDPRPHAASRAVSQICADAGDDMDAEARAVLCDGAVREGDGTVEASLTAAVPYAALQASERLKLWGAAGHGTGEVTLKPEPGGTLKADLSWTMAAAGLRGDVIVPPAEGSGPALAVTSDALWARTSSEKTHSLAASDSNVTRLRVGLEGSYRVALEEGGSVTPRLEVGARQDGGDAETGFGVELGGGLAWMDPRLGLSLDLSGRTLIAHGDDDLKDRGFAASLVFDPDPATKRGPSLTLTQDWGGQAKGGLDALFAPDPLEDRAGGGEATARWQAEAAYGFPAFSGRFTGSPHVGLGLATGARDYSLGWRLTPAANANAADVSFGVRAARRESDWAEPEHTVGLEATLRW